jgi:DNA-directed RNA polymerase specialized sigma24 family protein
MSGLISWIGAQADEPGPEDDTEGNRQPITPEQDAQSRDTSSPGTESLEKFPAHDFTEHVVFDEARLEDDPLDRNPDLWQYRKRTVALLRRYLRFSLETGRLPSFMGREFFRAKVTSYSGSTFEDRVIFVRDVEMCLNRLEYWDRQLVVRVILQEHNHEQAAFILHCCRKTVTRRTAQVLDLLSEDFLRVSLLAAVPPRRKVSQ